MADRNNLNSSSTNHAQPTSKPEFDIHMERDEGFRLFPEDTAAWRGWRVTYRRAGSKEPWAKFLMAESDPTVAHLEAICRKHSELKGTALNKGVASAK